MKKNDFTVFKKEFLESAAEIIKKDGICSGKCVLCPFSYEHVTNGCGCPVNYRDGLLYHKSERLLKSAKEYLKLYKEEKEMEKKEKKYYSMTDLLRQEVRILQKEIGRKIIDPKGIISLTGEEAREIIDELNLIKYTRIIERQKGFIRRLIQKIF